MELSVVIPVFRERNNIKSLVERIDKSIASIDYEILLVDDNSQDGSVELVGELSKIYPVKIHVRKNERGLATAVLSGIRKSQSCVVAVMDADLQHPPENLPELYSAAKSGADLVIASRYIPGGGCQNWGLIRRLISRGANFIAHLLLPKTRTINDPMSGFFVLDKNCINNTNLVPRGYKILLELVVMGKFSNMVEVPFAFSVRKKGKSKLNMMQQIDYLRHIWSLMQRSGEAIRFLKFALVGISGIAVNQGLLWFFTEQLGFFYMLSAAIGIETSILTNFTLNNYFTFADRKGTGIPDFLGRMLKFNLTSLAAVVINLTVLVALTELAGFHYLISNLFGIAVAFIWNYLVNNWWTWR